MDFIDWCHQILGIFDEQKFQHALGNHELMYLLFDKEVIQQGDFRQGSAFAGMHQAIKALELESFIQEENYSFKITPLGRDVLADPTFIWQTICGKELDSEEAKILKLICDQSLKIGERPQHAWLKEVNGQDFLAIFNIDPPPGRTNEHMNEIHKYVYGLPELLEQAGFLKTDARAGYHNGLLPTYSGLVWTTRRGVTLESKFIDSLVAEWETTNVDFKREVKLETKKQKGEFAKDILGLATTKSSGKRYLIIGFDDKTREYFSSPNASITQDRMEQILAELTDPVVKIKYDVLEYKSFGKVGKIEIIREPEKLLYRAKKDLFDDAGKKCLEKDKVYVRHGSHTESPSEVEHKLLEEEGEQARVRID